MEILVGDEHINCTPVIPYDERVCDMLDAWATEIRGDREAKAYPDVLTFGFFIRKGSISKKKKDFLRSCGGVPEAVSVNEGKQKKHVSERRLGRGLAFHIAPSNVPVNCMYTLVFGLLSGCANIVRVPSKEFPQVNILCRTLSAVLKKHKFSELADRIQVLRYDRDEKNASGVGMTEFFSSICDVRIIWGGDETIADIRKYPMGPRAKEITFADRYSFGIIDVQAVADATDDEIAKLAKDFYNDTYLMDQNACSSPHLIAWSIKGYVDASMQKRIAESGLADIPKSAKEVKSMMEGGLKSAQERFWKAVAKEASDRYDLADIKVSEKFADLCEKATLRGEGDGASEDAIINGVKSYQDNLLYVCDVDELNGQTIEDCRGKYGLFFQYTFIDIKSVLPVMDNNKVQTCAVYGIDTSEVVDLIVDNGLYGVDRVVPIGKTLDIDVVWDGYDLVREMSRVIEG